jgi:hypothetical protein
MNELEFAHPLNEGLLLLKSRLYDAGVDFFLENEEKIVVGVEFAVADEVQVV